VERLPEFRIMRALSPAYHAIHEEPEPDGRGRRILCRDLRTRNFKTTFGDLEATVPPDGEARAKKLHV